MSDQKIISADKLKKDLELANARIQAFMSQIDRLKAENLKLKQTIKIMERRIMEGING